MRHITIGLSILALLFSIAEPAFAGREGVPGRRVGGGSRWTQPKVKQSVSAQTRLTAMTFASRNNLPVALKLKAIYG
jgi:hypothetical protein